MWCADCAIDHGPLCEACGAGHYQELVEMVNGYPVCRPCIAWWSSHRLVDVARSMASLYLWTWGTTPADALHYAMVNLTGERRFLGDLSKAARDELVAWLTTYMRTEVGRCVEEAAEPLAVSSRLPARAL